MAASESKVIREYENIREIRGPLVIVEGISDAAYDEIVEVELPSGERRRGRVLETARGYAVVQVFEGTTGVTAVGTKVRFLARTLEVKVSDEMLGRVFNGLGDPIDGGPPITSGVWRDINGDPLNPATRAYPEDFIQTGVSAIDGMNTM
ncbi:V-type ATP synthase subunit B, partial [Pyrodictium delaneyi]